MKENEQRILDISQRNGLSHIGSCLSVLPILEEIYLKKKLNDKVIMDNAHAHLAHLVVMNSNNAEDLIKKYGIHCDIRAGCDASGGSLGHGIGISIGFALADRNRIVYCIVSDGSMQEGSNWEALRIKEQLKLDNLKIIANINGFTAVAEIDKDELTQRIHAFSPSVQIVYSNNGEGFEGVQGHYRVLK